MLDAMLPTGHNGVLSTPMRSSAVASLIHDIGRACGALERFPALCASLPPSLQQDSRTFHCLSNLLRPVDGDGTRGSYAGWITRQAIREAVVDKNFVALASLLTFFRRGGPLWELEWITAAVLRPFPVPSSDFSLGQRALAVLSPMGSWRLSRLADLAASEDPLRFSKMAELWDWRLWIEGSEAGGRWFRSDGQETAYFPDLESERVINQIQREAPNFVDEGRARERYQKIRHRLKLVLRSNSPIGPFGSSLVRGALLAIGDPLSRAVAGRIDREYQLDLASGDDFEKRVRNRHEQEGHRDFADPSTQNAIYFGRSIHGEPTLHIRERPLNLPWNLRQEDVLFEVLSLCVHEDRHHVDLETSGGRLQTGENFSLELRAHGTEFLWRALQGDPAWLRRFHFHSSLGFALGFRDYFEEFYRPIH